MRLEKLSERYNDQVEVRWKSYALLMGRVEARSISAHSRGSRLRASQEEPDAPFRPWEESKPYITSSLPALEAAKCAQLQGEEAFRAYHSFLFRAFFAESRDISDPEVLLDMAIELGLDAERFRADLGSEKQKVTVISEHLELMSEYGEVASGVPMVVVDRGQPVVGAAPLQLYARLIDQALQKRAEPPSGR